MTQGINQVIRILLVDDHPVFRQGLLDVLSDFPEFQIVGQASNGTEAVKKATELKPDVVIMDLRTSRTRGNCLAPCAS